LYLISKLKQLTQVTYSRLNRDRERVLSQWWFFPCLCWTDRRIAVYQILLCIKLTVPILDFRF